MQNEADALALQAKQDGANIQLIDCWKQMLAAEFEQDYIKQLKQFLRQEKQQGKVIYPPGKQMFKALNTTPFQQVKVVIIGQDPYHGPGQAHGLCFSVAQGVRPPPSLGNIFKEIEADLGFPPPNHGHLLSWAKQGVLLLNAVLSVEKGRAGSHQGKGWERFTDRIIACLNQQSAGLVFLLWGSYAQKKGQFIDQQKHLVLASAHPSPFSAHRGFLGNRHFSKTNAYLQQQGKATIDWQLSPL